MSEKDRLSLADPAGPQTKAPQSALALMNSTLQVSWSSGCGWALGQLPGPAMADSSPGSAGPAGKRRSPHTWGVPSHPPPTRCSLLLRVTPALRSTQLSLERCEKEQNLPVPGRAGMGQFLGPRAGIGMGQFSGPRAGIGRGHTLGRVAVPIGRRTPVPMLLCVGSCPEGPTRCQMPNVAV